MRTLFTLLISFWATFGYGTHLSGGYVSYRYLSGTTYEIKLTLYRDCNSATPFDGTPASTTDAIVGVFEANTNNLITTVNLTNPVITSIIGDTALDCLMPPSVCREVGVYTSTLTLPSPSTSYTLVHERCCLPSTIINIYTPGDQGSVFSATIPASSNNNSPIVNIDLARYIRIYDTVSITNWCTDTDGDSLVFSLTNPFSGGSVAAPAPNPPYGPPYDPITFYPGYTAIKPFGQTSTCSINSHFGQLQIIPQGVGIFLVNISVSEYRNSALLSEYPVLLYFTVTDCQGDQGSVNPGDTTATGIPTIVPTSVVEVYPNPAKNVVLVTGLNDNVESACLYDIKGTKLQEVLVCNGEAKFRNLEHYSPGVYLVQAGNTTKRLLIQTE